MKKIYLLLPLVLLALVSCFEDEGNYKYHAVDDIVIEGIEKSYSNNSYNGEVLHISPTIKTNYTDLEYEWWMWDPKKEESYTGWDENAPVYEAELIGTEKDLNYEVNCPIARYTVMLKVKSKSNGYFNTATTQFDAETKFARGFYILKETDDGNTELDMFNRDNELMPNLLTAVGYGPMKGKPRFLSMVQSNGMADEQDNYLVARTACVTTENNDIAFYNTENMEKVHDNSDVVEGGLKAGQIPYTAFSYSMSNFFLWSGGVNLVYIADMMPTSGIFYIPASATGASTHVMGYGDMEIYYWNEQRQSIDNANAYSWGPPVSIYDENKFSTKGMECIACGSSNTAAKGYWILKDKDGKRYIYESGFPSKEEEAEGAPKDIWGTRKRTELAADSKLAQATEFAVNELSSNVLYYAYNNKVYSYNLTNYTDSSQPFNLKGISDGETITYLSYQYQDYPNDTDYNFTHLVVGTQQGDTYRLYMYNIVAGEPQELVRTIEGKGKMKMCVYISPIPFYSNSGTGKTSFPN